MTLNNIFRFLCHNSVWDIVMALFPDAHPGYQQEKLNLGAKNITHLWASLDSKNQQRFTDLVNKWLEENP